MESKLKNNLFILYIFIIKLVNANDTPELKLVNVVFRHGDRAPDPVELFPKDQYYNYDFYPMGLGGLTNQGKLRVYHLGELLRQKYDKFLGKLYLPNSVEARSTDYERTKMCLELVLSSLYPPNGIQKWKDDLNWQPIPMMYVSDINDSLMIPEECPQYLEERRKVESSVEVKRKISQFKYLMKFLTLHTGKDIKTPNDMYNLYHILTAEKYLNLTLPEWSENIFPNGKLLDGINLEYEIFSYNDKMRRLNGGMLVAKFIDDMNKVRNNKMTKNRKIFVYSGHETNVAAVLQTLGLYKPHVPEYTSAVVTELYKLNSDYFIKVLYYKGIPSEFQELNIPGCDTLCPFDKFTELLNDVLPTGNDFNCKKTKDKPTKSKFKNSLLTNNV